MTAPGDVDSFRVTWAAPMDLPDHERLVLAGWLRVHGIERVQYRPNSGDAAVSVCVAEHPVMGAVIVSVQYVTDARGRYAMAYGSHTEVARRVHVQPLGMPPPAVLRERGEARARAEGLRLPVAALLSGRAS